MSQHLSRYQDWSAVPAAPAGLAVARAWNPDVVIDLTDDRQPSLDIDLTDDKIVEVLTVESEASPSSESPDDATYVTVHRDEWERMTMAARALLAVRAAAKVDAGVVPLGRHVDLRG